MQNHRIPAGNTLCTEGTESESVDLLKFMIGLSLIDTGRRQREELLDEVAVDEVTLLC